jgi:hypothetical protein
MGQLAFTFLFAGALVLFSCGSSGEEAANNASPDTTKTDTSMGAKDTLPHLPSPPDPAPAPGTMEMRGRVIAIHQADNTDLMIYDLKVLKILGVGASTPAVVLRDTLQVSASGNQEILENDTIIICTIKHQQVLVQHENTSPRWQMLRWEHTR